MCGLGHLGWAHFCVRIHRKSVPSGHSGKECPVGLQNQDLQKNCFLQPPAAQSALCVLPTTVFRSSLLAQWWITHLPMQEMSEIPGSGRSPGDRNGIPLQYSCLGNPMDRGTWWAPVHGVTKSQIQLSNWACMPRTKIPHALGSLSPHAATTKRSLQSVRHNWRSLHAATKFLWAATEDLTLSNQSINIKQINAL